MCAVDVKEKQKLTRGQKIWTRVRELRDNAPVSFERAKLVTASYKETEGLPVQLRRAKAFEKIVTGIPIFIDEDQWLVGDYAATPMGVEMHPDLEIEPLEEVIQGGIEGSESVYNIAEKDKPLLKEIYNYWKKWNIKESYIRSLDEDDLKHIDELGRKGSLVSGDFTISACIGWAIPNFAKAINKGFLGILDEVESELKSTRQLDNPSRDKVLFLRALKIILKAGIQYGKRYSALAKELARTAKGSRKKELEKIAEVCDWVPGHPARNFQEALQTLLFCHLLIYWDHRPNAISPGRVDQYLYPYYKKDTDEGKLTKEDVIELIECLRCKFTSKRQFLELTRRQGQAGETEFINCTLGGQTADGEDATNELSFLWLEAAKRTNTPHPTLSVRVHEKLSPEFAMKAAELCGLGLGYPAWFGDKTSIGYLLSKGLAIEEARDYALAGCLLHSPQNKSAFTWPLGANIPKIFEIALHDGVDPRLNKQIGPKTGKFEDMKSYDELYEAFKKQATYFITDHAKEINRQRLYRALMMPSLVASCFSDGCIKRGQDVMGGGSDYQHVMYLLPRGVMDAVDSLSAIKKLVFEEGKLTKKGLMDALAVNFEGKESVRKLLLSAPKYGNNDDFVDSIAADVYKFLCDLMGSIDACYGVKWVNAPHNLSGHGALGRKVGALPSGRLAGASIADGAVSPCQGADVSGCTAVIESCGKIDQLPIYGVLLNMKFHPSALKTEDDLDKFLSLVKTYLIDYGGKHVQFNVVSRETLLDAQAHPESYRNLVVRVAGYSALWVELDKVIQDEIISRTEHSIN
ncbi:MAG: pyruvate formate lyase family protein [Chloroflexota bacterium]